MDKKVKFMQVKELAPVDATNLHNMLLSESIDVAEAKQVGTNVILSWTFDRKKRCDSLFVVDTTTGERVQVNFA